MWGVRKKHNHDARGDLTHNHAYEHKNEDANHATSKSNAHAEPQIVTKWLAQRGEDWLLQIVSERQPCSPGCKQDLEKLEKDMNEVGINVEVYYFTPFSEATKKEATDNLRKLYIFHSKITRYIDERMPGAEDVVF